MSSRLRPSFPLLVLVITDLLWCSYLLASRRIPLGHDGFQYFYLKYYFFNDFVTNGELAQWLPYLTHGSPSSWWYVVQSGVFDPIGLLTARLFQFSNFLPVFYILLFFEKLLFLVGMWLLASEHYQSRVAVFVVSAAMTTTSIWYTQPWWNFHALIALPMLLFLAHRTIFDFRWTWLAALALLFFQQIFGHLSYYLPMTLLFLTAYVVLLLVRSDARAALRSRLRFKLGGVLVLLTVASAIFVAMIWLQRSSSDISFAFSSREPDGGVSLDTFLTYAGYTDLRGWNQFLTGLTPHLDFTLFSGFLIVGLTVLTFGERRLTRAQKLFAWLTIGTALLAAASPLATLVYYFWPLGRYFRHLALLQPVTKLFCILLAGATLDRLVSAPQSFRRTRVYGLTALLLPLTVLLLMFALSPERREAFIGTLSHGDLPPHPAYPAGQNRLLLDVAALSLTWVALFRLMRAFKDNVARQRRAWMVALLLFVDVSIYHRTEMRARTQKLSPQEASVFAFTALPYANQRMVTPEASGNSRLQGWSRPMSKVIFERYWSENLLWMVDSYQTTLRTVFWSEALGSLLQARTDIAKYGDRLGLPVDDKLLVRFGGLERSKVGFFTQAIACSDVASTGAVLKNPEYDGRVALLTVTAAEPGTAILPCDSSALAAVGMAPSPEPSANIVSFRSNSATFEVNNPGTVPLFMTYSDAWSSRWSARINGQPLPVLRSALAYKAVIVPPGRSLVEFVYRDRLAELVFALQTIGSVSFFGFLVWLIRWKMAGPAVGGAKRAPAAFSSSTT